MDGIRRVEEEVSLASVFSNEDPVLAEGSSDDEDDDDNDDDIDDEEEDEAVAVEKDDDDGKLEVASEVEVNMDSLVLEERS